MNLEILKPTKNPGVLKVVHDLRHKYDILLSNYNGLQKKHEKALKEIVLINTTREEEKTLRIDLGVKLRQTKRTLEKQRRKNRDKQAKIEYLEGLK